MGWEVDFKEECVTKTDISHRSGGFLSNSASSTTKQIGCSSSLGLQYLFSMGSEVRKEEEDMGYNDSSPLVQRPGHFGKFGIIIWRL